MQLAVAGAVLLVVVIAALAELTASGRRTSSDPIRTPGHPARASSSGPPPLVTVGAPLRVRPLPGEFMGLSLEYRSINEYAGNDPRAVNPLLVRLIKELSPGERPELRIGGDSTDRAWWPASGIIKPLGAYIRLNRNWGAVAGALVRATNARVMLGIDLEADSGDVAGMEARRVIAAIGRPRVQALELGNEPELYGAFTWYHLDGRKMPGRAPGWNFADYLREFSAIAKSLPRVPLAGPAAGSARWMRRLGRYIAAEPRVRIVTLHRYPLQRCYMPRRAPAYPTTTHLLAPASATGLADSVASDVEVAHAHGLEIRIDEVNTISCGRVPAVDESFASALWVLQTLFAFARAGVDGVNIHTYAGSPYALFKFHHHAGAWSAVVYPEYYGMRMFVQAAPTGSRLVSTSGAQRAGVQAWATTGPQREVRVVLIDTHTRARILTVRVPDGGVSATVERLLAPSLKARTGVTIGGQSFSAPNAAAAGSAHPGIERIRRQNGTYRVLIPGASAALLTIATR
jgi:Glycosyl hydrolase family 79 C-terminal beta domain